MDEIDNFQINRDLLGIFHFPMPDRFLDEETAEKAWTKLLSPGYKLKEYAAALAKLSDDAQIKRKAKHIPPAVLLSFFMGSSGAREISYEKMDSSIPIHKELMIERHYNKQIKRLPIEFLKSGTKLPKTLADMIPFIFREDIRIVEACFNKEAYSSLPYELKDIADFCLNTILCILRADPFAIAYLDACPWLKKRQESLYRSLVRSVESRNEHVSASQQLIQDASEIWCLVGEKIRSDHSESDSVSLQSSVALFKYANNLLHDRKYSPAVIISHIMADEVNRMAESIKNFVFHLEEMGLTLPDSQSQEMKEMLLTEDGNVAISSISPEHEAIFSEYLESQRVHMKPVLPLLDDIRAKIKERDDISKEINAIVSSNDVSQIEGLQAMGDELKGKVVDLNAMTVRAAACLRSHWLTLASCMERLRELEMAPVVVESTTPKEDFESITQELASTIAENASLKEQVSQAVAREQEMTALNEYLLNEVNNLKVALHAARHVPVVPHATEHLSMEISGDWLRGILKEEGRSTPEQILVAYANIAPDRLRILPSAIKSARDASNFEMPHRLAQLLDNLVYTYLDDILSGTPDDVAREVLGSRYAANESDTVMNNKRLRAMREFDCDGEVILFRQHVGIGNGYGTQSSIRLYFKVINNQVVVAYCGEHLETARTC